MKTPAKFKEYIWLVKKTQRSRPHVHNVREWEDVCKK